MLFSSGALGRTVRRFIAATLAVALAAGGVAVAQDDPADQAVKLLNAAELKTRLAELEQELEAEDASIAGQKLRHDAELKELQDQRGELARRLLVAQSQRELNVDRLSGAKAKAEQTAGTAEAIVARDRSIPPVLHEAAEQLRLLLRETPGMNVEMAQARDLAAAMVVPAMQDEFEPRGAILPAARDLFKLMDRVHENAGRVTVRNARLFTASDREEEVQLLALGLTRFAYVTRDDHRAGLALASPGDAAGYRWSEDLPQLLSESIHAALASLESGRATTISFPLDPTGRVEPHALNQHASPLDTFRLGGPVMYPIAFITLLAVSLVSERLVSLYLRNRGAGTMADEVIAACAAGRFEEARQRCERAGGTVGRVMAACLSRRSAGQRGMEDAIQEQLLHEVPTLQRSLGGIAVLAGVAPMLGLLGTVTGIISTFEAIRAFGAVNPESMAAGISEALIATAAGLMIAIPVVILHSMLRGRADGIAADSERYSAALLTTLLYGPASAAGPTSAETAAHSNGRQTPREPALAAEERP